MDVKMIKIKISYILIRASKKVELIADTVTSLTRPVTSPGFLLYIFVLCLLLAKSIKGQEVIREFIGLGILTIIVVSFWLISHLFELYHQKLFRYEDCPSWQDSVKKEPVEIYSRCATCVHEKGHKCPYRSDIHYFTTCGNWEFAPNKSIEYYVELNKALRNQERRNYGAHN